MPDPATEWATAWLAPVAEGRSTMSQRKLSSIDVRGGGLDGVKAVAHALGVHLVRLVDDRGQVLVAASRHPFDVIA